MWAPIFEQNAEYLGQALAEYIMHLQRFHYQLMKRNTKELYRVLQEANKIRKVLDMPPLIVGKNIPEENIGNLLAGNRPTSNPPGHKNES